MPSYIAQAPVTNKNNQLIQANNVCGKQLQYSSDLHAHNRTNANKEFGCNACGKKYIRKGGLTRHIKVIHENETKYKCDICDEQFAYRYILKDHINAHTGKNEFKCNICGRKYGYLRSLKAHILIKHTEKHKGEKQFKCNICNRKYEYLQSLRAHIRALHTDKKEFKCDECNKIFNRKDNLIKHKKRKHKILPKASTLNSLIPMISDDIISATDILIKEIISVTRL
ncbi:hypothetical protein DINM_005786 [Dirofilaria immitis]|nr:hypothetical protein [Dirofilaria immitis]